MIEFEDSFGFRRCIDISKSFNDKYINFTVYVPSKGVTGNSMQIPLEAARQLVELIIQVEKCTKTSKE